MRAVNVCGTWQALRWVFAQLLLENVHLKHGHLRLS